MGERIQIYGFHIGKTYVSIAGPKHRPLFSERHRIGVSVIPLLRGWRIRIRNPRHD